MSLTQQSNDIPAFQPVTADKLKQWDFSETESWQTRLDSGSNITVELDELLWRINSLAGFNSNRSDMEKGQIFATTGPIIGQLNMMKGLQEIDFRESILSNIPLDERSRSMEYVRTNYHDLVISNDPVVYGLEEMTLTKRKMILTLGLQNYCQGFKRKPETMS